MLKKIYDILVYLLGESKQGYFDPACYQYQFNCCYCADEKGRADGKYNLEVNLAMGKFHCWSCEEAGNLSKLIKDRGGRTLLEEYFAAVKDLKESKFYDINLFNDLTLEGYNEDYIRLPESFTKVNLNTCPKALREYLNKRKITQDIIDEYNIGYIPYEEEDWRWRNRLIIPSYSSTGDMNYFIGRTFRDNDKRQKYRNCTADKNKIILHEDKIQWDADIVLVEGAIDCIYYPNSIAMMGKSLKRTGAIYSSLVEKSNGRIIICLDADTNPDETKRIYKTLNSGRLRGKVWFVNLSETDYKDFGEAYEAEGKTGIIKVLRLARQYTPVEIL